MGKNLRFLKKVLNLFLWIFSIYIFLEIVFFVLMGFPRFSNINIIYLNRDCISFDPIMGSRLTDSKPCRLVRIVNGKVIYDNIFKGNNMGYNSYIDFVPKKSSPDVFRIVVLGDSFTAEEFLKMPWPQKVQNILNEKYRKVEIYPFAIDGGGLYNWYSIMKKEVFPKFDMDALIIAIFPGDLMRGFSIFHSTESSLYFIRLGQIPRTPEIFNRYVLPRMRKLGYVANDDSINKAIKYYSKWHHPQIRPNAVIFITKQSRRFIRYLHLRRSLKNIISNKYKFDWNIFKYYYGEKRVKMLAEIIETCKKRKIPVILSSVPSWEEIIESKYHRPFFDIEIEGIAKHFGIYYHNGYKAFQGHYKKRELFKNYYTLDAHWTQMGSNTYAKDIANYIIKLFNQNQGRL